MFTGYFQANCKHPFGIPRPRIGRKSWKIGLGNSILAVECGSGKKSVANVAFGLIIFKFWVAMAILAIITR
jgi:hypothetical protein